MSDFKAADVNQTAMIDSVFPNSEKHGMCKVSMIGNHSTNVTIFFLLFAVLVDNNDNYQMLDKQNLWMPSPISTENLHVQIAKTLKSSLRHFSRFQTTLAVQSSTKHEDINERFRKLLIEPRTSRCYIYIWEPFLIVVRGTRARIEIILCVEQPLTSPVHQPQPQQQQLLSSSQEMDNPDEQNLGKCDAHKDSIILSPEQLTLPNPQPEPQQQPSSSSPEMDVKPVGPKIGIVQFIFVRENFF